MLMHFDVSKFILLVEVSKKLIKKRFRSQTLKLYMPRKFRNKSLVFLRLKIGIKNHLSFKKRHLKLSSLI